MTNDNVFVCYARMYVSIKHIFGTSERKICCHMKRLMQSTEIRNSFVIIQLTVMPEELDLPNLETLLLWSNSLTEVPSGLKLKLPSLKYLSLSINQLTVMPELDFLPNLEELHLRGNPSISKIPDSLCDQEPYINIYADKGTCANSKPLCCG